METKIIITRTRQYANFIRRIFVFIDGQRVGSLRHGETKTFDAVPGRHELRARIDWSWSKPIRFELGVGQTVALELGCSVYGWRVLLPWYYLLVPERYLYLRKAEPSAGGNAARGG